MIVIRMVASVFTCRDGFHSVLALEDANEFYAFFKFDLPAAWDIKYKSRFTAVFKQMWTWVSLTFYFQCWEQFHEFIEAVDSILWESWSTQSLFYSSKCRFSLAIGFTLTEWL